MRCVVLIEYACDVWCGWGVGGRCVRREVWSGKWVCMSAVWYGEGVCRVSVGVWVCGCLVGRDGGLRCGMLSDE
jgi:hypothetical protein